MIKDQSKFAATAQVFLALSLLFSVFQNFQSALSYSGLENSFLADNWSTPLIVLIIILFGLGWWYGGFFRYLMLSKGLKIAMLALASFFVVFIVIQFSSFALLAFGFWRYAMIASGYILMSGFLLRFSVVIPEVITKQRQTG